MDKQLMIRGVRRSPFRKFILYMLPWFALLGFGLYAMYLIFSDGLHYTNMDNRFAFGLWIYYDLAIIALGAGAFFTGLLLYVFKRYEFKAVINSAVVLGFISYSGAILALVVDVGQPLRAWFTLWRPNAHSMLAEVTFCLSLYLTVLAIEYVPIVLKNRKLKQIPSFLVFEFNLHKLMPVLAGVGALLSFFHQGSLGGMFGVLEGQPFSFRETYFVFPTTFFLFVISAIAVGPSFIVVTTWIAQKLSGKRLVKKDVLTSLAKISGSLLIVYVLLKSIDTLVWLNKTSPSLGFMAHDHYAYAPFGIWILLTEILVLGLIPALILINPKLRANTRWLITGAFMACAGIVLNRFVVTIQTLSLPTLPFADFLSYVPSWQELAVLGAVVSYCIIVYSFSFRYLPLFPQERELNQSIKEV
jgi:menaquinone reductase, integral membrane subunit